MYPTLILFYTQFLQCLLLFLLFKGLSVANFFLAEKGIPGVVVVLILVAAFIFLSVALTFWVSLIKYLALEGYIVVEGETSLKVGSYEKV